MKPFPACDNFGFALRKTKSICFRRAVLGFLCLGATLFAFVGASQNLANNPGFETANTAGWSPFGSVTISASTAQAHSGTYSGRVTNRTDTYMGISQSLQSALTSGQIYDISAWVRLASGASQTVNLTMKKTDAGGTTYSSVASGSVSSTAWTQLSGSYALNVSGSLTSLVLYAEVPTSTNVSYYLDDLSVQAQGGGSVTGSTNGQCTVIWTNVFQRIDGFGASSAWRSTWNASLADMFFSTNSGIGLSLLRTRITPAVGTVENSIMQMAQARGARVWSAPWSPPTTYKGSNANNVVSVNGGPFIGNAANYQAYANQLAGYVLNMKNTYGINLYALSVQNEPDTDTTSYESCVWTGNQIRDFVPYLSAALASSNVAATKILLPESIHWPNTSLHTPALTDVAVAPLVSILANHNYDGPNFQTGATTTPVALNSYGKALWETEVSTGDAYDGSIANALYWAGRIHQFLTVAQVNAWHFWWLIDGSSGSNQGLTDTSGNPAKRMYALGQFSRFVRPDFYRIGVVSNTGPLQISAYKNATNGAVVIIAINASTNNVAQTFNLSGFGVTNITPWLTSASASLASQSAVAVAGSSFSNTIPAMSIVTLVGQATVTATNSAPTDISLSNSAVGENQPSVSAVGALNTTDPNSGNTFAYALVSGAGSTGNAAFSISGNNLLTASSFNYEAQNSYSIRIRSTDQGGLFFEKAFLVVVTNVNEAPTLAPVPEATIGAGVSLALTNIATDAELPAQTLTFNLLAAPTNATLTSLNASNALFTWRPLISQSPSTNVIRVKVTDNGTPALSTTNNFVITISAATRPLLNSITVGSHVNLSATGLIGPDYSLFTTTNLVDWQLLLTTNPTAMPVLFTDTNRSDAARFYRLQLGP